MNKKWIGLASIVALSFVHCGGDDGGGDNKGTGGEAGASGDGGSGGDGEGGDGGTSGGTGGGGQEGTLCEQRCAKTADKCPNEPKCVEACQLSIDTSPWCSSIVTTFVACTRDQPAAAWMCDQDGHSKLPADVCQSEAAAAVLCVANGPPGGMPDMTNECTKSCAAMASLSCALPNCVQTCLDGIRGEHCAGAAGLVALCGADLTSADYQCSSSGPPVPTKKCAAEMKAFAMCLAAIPTD